VDNPARPRQKNSPKLFIDGLRFLKAAPMIRPVFPEGF
jgi:hypothetical protein